MLIIEILKVIVLGIVVGFSKWLPISSAGHIMLVQEIVPLNQQEAFREVFLAMLQLGSILSVVFLYFKKLNPFDTSKKPSQRRASMQLWYKIAIASVPVAVFGLLLGEWVETHLKNPYVVAVMMIFYGILFLVMEHHIKYKTARIEKTTQLTYQLALYIGMFQLLYLIPGSSRAAVTILGALLLGCSRSTATEFSLFLGIPVVFGSSMGTLIKLGMKMSGIQVLYVLIGIFVTFMVTVYSIKFLMGYIKNNDFKFFGYYRIVLGIVILIYFGLTTIVQ